MNTIIFRFLIVIVIVVHITFVSIGNPSQFIGEPPIYILPWYLWSSIYLILLVSLIGLFLKFKFSRHIFFGTVVICMGIVAMQGGIVLSALENVLLQVGSGLYGGIIAMAYFGNIKWRKA